MTTKVHTCPVVGVTFVATYPTNLRLLAKVEADAIEADRLEWLRVALTRNFRNHFDANAVEVRVPALGPEMELVGHLPAGVARRLAPLLDDGVRFAATIHARDHGDLPGADVSFWRAQPKAAA